MGSWISLGKGLTSLTGIKRRLLVNYIISIIVILTILEGAFIFFIKDFYLKNVKDNISNRVSVTAGFISKYMGTSIYSVDENMRRLVEDYPEREFSELQIIDTQGNMLLSSSGFSSSKKIFTKDYINALAGEVSAWTGNDPVTGEKVIAVSAPIGDEYRSYWVIRCVASIEEIAEFVDKLIIISLIAVAVIIIFITLLTVILSKSIINPINEINSIAKEMAKGNFSERIDKKYNDEIGELADTLNFMASEISRVDQIKNDFISSISHELRTPLTAIRGWSETILTGDFKDKEETQKGLKIIIKEAGRLSNMVEELLDFSRLESGRLIMFPAKVNVVQGAEEVTKIYQARSKKNNIDIYLNIDDPIPEVYGDENRLRQVFVNIIDNAVKFSNSNEDIYVRVYSDDIKVFVEVADKGIGISPKDLPKVKKKFYRGKTSRSGSGIGLGISDEIIKLHHGSIDIQSQEGKGTTVTIAIPIEQKLESCKF